MDIKGSWRISLVRRMEQRQAELEARLLTLERSKNLRATAERLKAESEDLFTESELLSSSEDLEKLEEAVHLLERSLEKIQGANMLAKKASELAASIHEDTWTEGFTEVARKLEFNLYKLLFC